MGWSRKQKQKDEEPIQPSRPKVAPTPPQENAPTQLGRTVVIEGELHAQEDVLRAGTIKGRVDCKSQITVSETGRIEGSVKCRAVKLLGEIHGNVEAAEKIEIEASGKLVGDITTKVFIHQPGGFFEGYSHMIPQSTRDKPMAKGSLEAKKTVKEPERKKVVPDAETRKK